MKKGLCVVLGLVMILGSFSVSNASSEETVGQNSMGESVVRVQIRLRELGYLNFKPTGNFKSMSVAATIAFQTAQSSTAGGFIYADGTVGPQTSSILFSARALRAAIPAHVTIPIGPPLQSAPTVKGDLVPWTEVRQMLTEGKTYSVTDYNTGTVLKLVYAGGEGHAEVECADSYESDLFLEIFGGTYNYSKRPVIIAVNGQKIAASLYGYPHGADKVSDNGMDGHTCLFFDGSLSHVGSAVDVEHQKQVQIAAG